MDQSLLLVRNPELTLNGVVQHVAKHRADIHHVHKAQLRSVRHTGKLNLVLGTVEALSGEHRVQYGVARLVLGLVIADFLLHAVQKVRPLLGVRLRAQHSDLVLQVVVFPVDEVDALPALPVLDILVLKDVLHRIQLILHPQLAALNVVGIEHHHPGQVHQRTDVIYIADVAAAEGGIGVDKAQVAHGKTGKSHHQGGPKLPWPHRQRRILHRGPALQAVHHQEHRPVDHRGKGRRVNKAVLSQAEGSVGIELPLQRGGKLRQQEGPHRAIAHTHQGHIAAQGDAAEHHPNSHRHTGDPQCHRPGTGHIEEEALDHQKQPQHAPQPPALQPLLIALDVDQARPPLRQGREHPGDTGHHVHRPTPLT